MELVENTLLILGVIAVLWSLTRYYRRTREKVSPGKLLKGMVSLNASEFLANRLGLYLLVMGVMIRYVNQLT